MLIIKGTPFGSILLWILQDKHRKFCAIMTEILHHFGLTEIYGLL